MADKQSNPSFQFVVDYRERKPDASFAEIRDAAAKKKFKIFPIVYGRAKALLGLVESKPRGTGPTAMASKAARAAAAGGQSATAAAPKRRGRPPKSASAGSSATASLGGSGGLADLVTAVRNIERERDQMRAALLKLREVVEAAL